MDDYAYSIDAVNALASADGSGGSHAFLMDAFNEWAIDLGGEGGHAFLIDAVNEIVALVGGEGEYFFLLNGLNEISRATGGEGDAQTLIDALNALAAGGVTGGDSPALNLPFFTMSSGADLTAKGVTFTRSGNATMYDSTGKLTWAPNNLLLNSDQFDNWTLASGATFSGGQYTLPNAYSSIIGKDVTAPPGATIIGSVVIKGTGTAQLVLQDNSGSYGNTISTELTLTPTGTAFYIKRTIEAGVSAIILRVVGAGVPPTITAIERAQVEVVTHETTPRAYVATTSAAYYGPRFDHDPATLAAKGLLIEEARTNILLNATIDGANLATQSVTVSAQAYTLSFYGAGSVTLSGAASGTLTGTGAFPARSTLTFTPTAGSLTLTVSGAVQYAMCEAGSGATSFVPTGATSVTRASEAVSVPIPAAVSTIRHTYSDNTTADVSVTPSGTYNFPTGKTYKSTVSVGA